MSLDIFSTDINDAVSYATRTSGADLPSTFSDNFNESASKGYLVNWSAAGELRKLSARNQMVDDAITKTGDRSFDTSGEGGGFDIAAFNSKVAQHKAQRPDLDLQPMSTEGIQTSADEIGTRQLADSAHADQREKTFGGKVGSFLGTTVAAVTDPVNMLAFPLAAPEALGVLGTALAWGGIGAGSQAAIEALNSSSMERIEPGYGASTQPVQNVVTAGLLGGAIGGGLKGAAALWTKQKTGAWPRTVRDAGNVVESEAQIAATNPLPGVEGEAAHRTALNKAIDDIAHGRPVDVGNIVTPEQLAAMENRAAPVLAARDAAVEAQLAAKAVAEAPAAGPLVVARKMPDGSTRIGKPGEIHADLVDPEASPLSVSDDQMGFAASDGKFLSRDEATAMLDKNYPDLSKKIDGRRDGPVRQIEAGQYNDAVRKSLPPQIDLPFAQTEAAALAEAKGATLTEGIQNIAKLAGHDMPLEDAAKIADRIAKLDDPDKARALLDEVFVRPQTVADTLPVVERAPAKTPKHQAGNVQPIDEQLTPDNIEKMRVDPDLGDTVSRDLDKLMLERPDLEVPMGVTVDAEGRTVHTTRKVEDVIAEADAKLAAAKEIELCVGPYAEAAE